MAKKYYWEIPENETDIETGEETGNIITHNRGQEEIKTYIALILVTSLVSCCFLNMSGLMESSDYNKYANKSYDSIFKYNLRG